MPKKISILMASAVIVGAAIILGGIVSAKPENPKGEYVQDEIIVKFKGDAEPFRVIKVPEGKVGEKIKEHLARKDIVYAEPNYIAYALIVPDDPYYKYQWHLDNSVNGGIQMEEAWDISAGAGVTVAVVDTGIRKGTDLANTCFVPGWDYVNNDSDPIDDNGHGTHVAGTIAQSTNNALGAAGVAFNSCLMPVKVLNSGGSGTYAQVADGIRYAADEGVKVINLSLGGSSDSSTLKDAVAYAYQKGVTVIAAAGNDSSAILSYPAAYNDYVIAVGATRYDETLAYYSNYGPSLDLVAPGGDLNVDQNKDGYVDGVLQQTFQKTGTRISWGYYFFQGTSMAAPHVSGVSALLIAKGNATTPDQIRTALQTTAEDKGTTGRDDIYGYGLVDAYAALGWTAAPQCTSDAQCDDGLYCNGTETCVAGVCKAGTPVDCSALNGQCNDGVCNETTSNCIAKPKSDGTACDDGLYCNTGEMCQVGVCIGGSARVCNDEKICTADSCSEEKDVCEYIWPTCGILDSCCGPECSSANDRDCAVAVKCWNGTNLYLYQAPDQAKKFCKCAQGTYGYNSYKSNRATKTVWKYVDPANNENWQVTSTSSKTPVYSVTCINGKVYPTNVDYTYPK
ncbi:MAG: S8 family peptidase [Patescibacteria group bacterium]